MPGEPFSLDLAKEFQEDFQRVLREIGKVIVGQQQLLEHVLISLFSAGHILLEGAPGLGKTLLVRTIADVLNLSFSRIQFTPDLMPTDITGAVILIENESGRRDFQFRSGPIFANIVLADEINRATPKTQSALLECMQENRVTVMGKEYPLKLPFLVLGTQNPIEMEGTYPLPEAQLDRFLFKLCVNYPSRQELNKILERTCGGENTRAKLEKVVDGKRFLKWMKIVREVYIAPEVQDYAVRLTLSTHPDSDTCPEKVGKYIQYGSSPRGAQAIVVAAKVKALTRGRCHVSYNDIATVCKPALRHRVLLNFEGESQGISGDIIVEEIVKKVLPSF